MLTKIPERYFEVAGTLFGLVACSRVEKDGVTSDAYSPFGNVGLTGAAAVGAGVAVLMPALSKARGAARTAACKNNLKSIGLAIDMYRADHGQKMPATLAALLEGEYIDEKGTFKCPSAKGAKVLPSGLALSYEYAGPLPPGAPQDAIVVYDGQAAHRGKGRNVLLYSGSVKWMNEAQFQAKLAKQKQDAQP